MERTQYDWQHKYTASPSEYPISANENHSTYDQFIQLRDTLIFTGKYYNDKAGKRLCVWDKGDWTTTNTIEVWIPNFFRQGFQPTWTSWDIETSALPAPSGKYITEVPANLKSDYPTFWNLCCMINKDWHYRIIHKEEVLLSAWIRKVYCYVDVYRKNAQDQFVIQYKWWVAVFDWESQDNVPYAQRLWGLFKKITAFWYQERDLLKWDILVLRMKDGTYNPSTWEPTGNDLTLQNDSNYWSIEYLDLPYNI